MVDKMWVNQALAASMTSHSLYSLAVWETRTTKWLKGLAQSKNQITDALSPTLPYSYSS